MLLETVTSTIESSNDKAILKKVINNKKKIYFEEKIVENRNNPKELWRTLISLCMPSKRGMESKILKENGVVSFNSNDNAKFFVDLGFSQTQQIHCYRNFYVQKINLESKLLKSIISIFDMNVRILFCAM